MIIGKFLTFQGSITLRDDFFLDSPLECLVYHACFPILVKLVDVGYLLQSSLLPLRVD